MDDSKDLSNQAPPPLPTGSSDEPSTTLPSHGMEVTTHPYPPVIPKLEEDKAEPKSDVKPLTPIAAAPVDKIPFPPIKKDDTSSPASFMGTKSELHDLPVPQKHEEITKLEPSHAPTAETFAWPKQPIRSMNLDHSQSPEPKSAPLAPASVFTPPSVTPPPTEKKEDETPKDQTTKNDHEPMVFKPTEIPKPPLDKSVASTPGEPPIPPPPVTPLVVPPKAALAASPSFPLGGAISTHPENSITPVDNSIKPTETKSESMSADSDLKDTHMVQPHDLEVKPTIPPPLSPAIESKPVEIHASGTPLSSPAMSTPPLATPPVVASPLTPSNKEIELSATLPPGSDSKPTPKKPTGLIIAVIVLSLAVVGGIYYLFTSSSCRGTDCNAVNTDQGIIQDDLNTTTK